MGEIVTNKKFLRHKQTQNPAAKFPPDFNTSEIYFLTEYAVSCVHRSMSLHLWLWSMAAHSKTWAGAAWTTDIYVIDPIYKTNDLALPSEIKEMGLPSRSVSSGSVVAVVILKTSKLPLGPFFHFLKE